MILRIVKSKLFKFPVLLAFALGAFPFVLMAQTGNSGQGSGSTPNFFEFLLRPKFITMIVIAAVAFILLISRRMNNSLKVAILLISTFLYGIAANLNIKIFSGFSMHPSPVCSATKSLLYGFRMPMIVTLAVIVFLTLIGPKLFCGWICPVGSIQELISMLADKLAIRRRKLNFRFTQTVRLLLIVLFIFLSLTAVVHTVSNDKRVALSIYDYINAFNGYKIKWQPNFLDNLFNFAPFLLTIIFAFWVYRPFCYLVCPVGLLTNLLEQISIFRVVRKKDACTNCNDCIRKSPCPAIPEILKGAALRPDCFACTVCIKSCPQNFLEFGFKDK